MNLFHDFMTNDGKLVHKWVHYFPIYERHFLPFRNKSLTFLEIGVSEGGSLEMWQRYLGPLSKIVGIDINEECRRHESPGIFIRIGDQADEGFLQRVIDEFGVPDVVLDDGSHQMSHMSRSFDFFYPRLPKNGVYMIEDLHTCYWPEFGGGIEKPETFLNRSKLFIDRLNADHTRGAVPSDFFTKQTFSMSFYDSVIVFEKGTVWRKEAPATGRRIPRAV